MKRSFVCLIIILLNAVLMSGCATTGDPYRLVENVGIEHNFKKEYIKTELCTLTSFYKFTKPDTNLTVYIEGDGSKPKGHSKLPDDPTPRHQLVLSLAAVDPSENVAYIARPGQLTEAEVPDCDPVYWLDKRYSREVINSVNSAIDRLKAESKAQKIDLVGFSGGAAIAVIIAAERNDVVSIRTISGALDHEALMDHHNATHFVGSLNAIDFADKVSGIPQRHFLGDHDKLVPIFIVESFAEKIGDKNKESITLVKGVTHLKGWKKMWPALRQLSLYRKYSER